MKMPAGLSQMWDLYNRQRIDTKADVWVRTDFYLQNDVSNANGTLGAGLPTVPTLVQQAAI